MSARNTVENLSRRSGVNVQCGHETEVVIATKTAAQHWLTSGKSNQIIGF